MVLLALLLNLMTPAFAYIPPSDFVLEQVAKNAGKGNFYIENEVLFRSSAESITVKEQWWVQDSLTMRMVAKGPGVNIQYSYKDGRSEFVNDQGKSLSRKVPSEMLERFLFSRQAKTLSDLLNSAKVIQHNAAKIRPRFTKASEAKPEEDPHLHLDRIGSDVMITLTQSPDRSQLTTSPGIWIDQSNFAIRRIRFAAGSEMNAQFPTPLSQGLVLPKERILTWPTGSAEIRMVKANSVTKLDTTEIPMMSPNTTGSSALSLTIKEFYSRFR